MNDSPTTTREPVILENAICDGCGQRHQYVQVINAAPAANVCLCRGCLEAFPPPPARPATPGQRTKTMKNSVFSASLWLILMLGPGCCAFVPPKQEVTLTAQPTNAVLIVNNVRYPAPLVQKFWRDKPIYIQASAPGWETQYRTINPKVNGLAALDTVGGLLWGVPLIGLLTHGTHNLETTELYIDLTHPYTPPPLKKPVQQLKLGR